MEIKKKQHLQLHSICFGLKKWLRGFYLVSWLYFGKYIFHVVLEWTRIPSY